MSALRWSIPYPPFGTNHMYVWTGRGGQRRLCTPAEKWRDRIIVQLRDGGQPKPPPGLLSLRLDLYPPDARKRDVDGPIKLAQDAIADALGFDDYRIVLLMVRRHPPSKGRPRLEVELATDPESMPLSEQSTRGVAR